MAKSYIAKIQVNCWKEHSCAGCGCAYSYNLVRQVQGRGGTPERAKLGAQMAAKKAAEVATDLQPCPTCGLYQPDMIGQRRAKRQIVVFWIALCGLGVTLILRLSNGLQANVVTWAAAAIAGCAVLAHLLIDLHNPNSALETNRQVGQQRAAEGVLRYVPGQSGPVPQDLARPTRSVANLATLVLLLASVLLIVAPELLRTSRGWPLNDNCYPPVVGPGDTTRVYMPGEITSIKSYWKGKPAATLHDPGDPTAAGIPMDAVTNENGWTSTIYAKSSEKNLTSHPWVDLTFPATQSLAGKTVTCDIDMTVVYPHTQGSGYVVQTDAMHHSLQVRLAPAGSGALYNSFWWGATLTGIGLLLACGLFLFGQAKASQRQAKPTRVYV